MTRVAAILLLCGVVLGGPGFAQDDALQLAPGDTLTIRVARLPELDRDAMIGPDGAIRVAGTAVQVAGKTLDDAQQEVVAALTREIGTEPTFVLVDVAEWRPVVVYGDGVRGGELPWRPGMTVRRAIAAAEARQSDENAPRLLEILEAQRAETRVLDETDRLARALVRVAVLEAELVGQATPVVDPGDSGVDPAVLESSHTIETKVHALRRERLEQQRENLKAQKVSAVGQIGSMAEEMELQRRRVNLFEEQLAASEELSARGLSTQDRVSNRQADLMNAQLLVVRLMSEQAEVQSRQTLIDSLIDELDTNWLLDLTRELNDARATAVAARNALELARRNLAASDQILGVTMIGTTSHGYLIHRPSENGPETVAADPDMAILPGDVLQVIRK